MKSYKHIFFLMFLLLFRHPTLAQSLQKNEAKKDIKAKPKSFVLGVPILAGLFGGKSSGLSNVFIGGAEVGYGKIYNYKWWIGTKMSYAHTFIQGLKGSNQAEITLFGEHHFLPTKKVNPLFGFRTYMFLFQYTPQVQDYQFFNDPLDGISRTRLIPGMMPYVGLDFAVSKKSHIVLAYGYDYKITKKPELIPKTGKQGTDWILEFRMELGKTTK